MGQDARTSLTQAVAEELRAPLGSIRLVMGDTDLTPFDAGTFGSRTTPAMAPQLRKAAAAAREALKERAAAEWGVEKAALQAEDGFVIHPPSRRRSSFGALGKGQKLVRVLAGDGELTPPERWTVAGHDARNVKGADVVTGRHRYTSDLTQPGLWHGQVLRPPAAGATLASLDATAAEALPGVVVVRDGEFAGVAAARAPLAARALEALRPAWKTTPQLPGRELWEKLRKPVAPEGQRGRRGAASGGGLGGGRAGRRPPPASGHLPGGLHRARAAGAAGGGRGVARGPAHGLDGNAAPVRRARRAGRGLPPARGPRARDRARHRLRLRRQTHAASARSRRRGWPRPPAIP